MKIAKDVTELIGNTPMLRLSKLSDSTGVEILGKCEFMNPSGSVKDRIGFSMVDDALKKGRINEETTIIEPTSGNTGIALASVCAAKNLKLILIMPGSMTVERQKLLRAFGAKLELTAPEKGMTGAISRARELSDDIPNSIILQQFMNESNPRIHRITTANEIWNDTDGKVDILVAAVGTGGTITGTGEILKEKNPDIQIIAVEPKDSPVLSGGSPGPHKIQGIGAGFIPEILNVDIYQEIILVSNEDAFQMARQAALEEGILVGISAGANIHAAFTLARREENRGKTIVTILCDTGERYLSADLFE